MIDDETTDVLIGGYLSTEAAHEDYEAVLGCGERLWGAVVVSKDLDGSVSLEQTDHTVEEGAAGLAGVGFVVGLVRTTAARCDRDRGGHRRRRGQGVAQEDRQQYREDGRGDDPHRWGGSDRRVSTLSGGEGRTGRDPRDCKRSSVRPRETT